MRNLKLAVVLTAAVVLVAVACDDGTKADPGPSGSSKEPGTSTTLLEVTTTTVGSTDCPGGPGDISTLHLKDNSFEPACLTINEAQALRVTNVGTRKHNFTFEGISKDLEPQKAENFQPPFVEKIKPGSYQVFCKYHKDQGMKGTITVVRPS